MRNINNTSCLAKNQNIILKESLDMYVREKNLTKSINSKLGSASAYQRLKTIAIVS